MRTKASKAQMEVWQYKENLYEELKTLPQNEWLQYIRRKVAPTMERLKKKK